MTDNAPGNSMRDYLEQRERELEKRVAERDALLNEAVTVMRRIEELSAIGHGAQNSENRREHLRSVNEIARALLSKLEGGK